MVLVDRLVDAFQDRILVGHVAFEGEKTVRGEITQFRSNRSGQSNNSSIKFVQKDGGGCKSNSPSICEQKEFKQGLVTCFEAPVTITTGERDMDAVNKF